MLGTPFTISVVVLENTIFFPCQPILYVKIWTFFLKKGLFNPPPLLYVPYWNLLMADQLLLKDPKSLFLKDHPNLVSFG